MEITIETTTSIFYISLAGVTLGLIYAYIIAKKIFNPEQTWVSVVVGEVMTDTIAFSLIYIITKDPILSLMPVYGHLLTGIPMIIGQILKHRRQNKE